MNSSLDALLNVKRGFLIIGLTGHTGSGHTRVSALLSDSKKPKLPDLVDILQAPTEAVTGRKSWTSNMEVLRDEKLKKMWEKHLWRSFREINVSKVIFSLALKQGLSGNKPDVIADYVEKAEETRESLEGLGLFISDEPIDHSSGGRLISSFEALENIFNDFKKEKETVEYIRIMQTMGDELRKFGIVGPNTESQQDQIHLPIIANAIRRLIKAYRKARKEQYFVVDSFRNAYEVEYFKRRYTEFYLVAVFRNPLNQKRLLKKLGFTDKEVISQMEGKEHDATSQNIDACMQKADVFIEYKTKKNNKYIRYHLIKFLSLYSNPGCLPPTQDERCMQIAVTARQMSGCISRQVGAVVTDKYGYMLGVGWNDPPAGQVPCALRSGDDLINGRCLEIFSDFEKDPDFVQHLKEQSPFDSPFCFREELGTKEGGKKAEYTRAIHAEENALFQALKNKGDLYGCGAILYSSASTCTLCAKKAYHLGVSRIVYIEEYPGIALEQTVKTGSRTIILCKFVGITGSAFFKLFTPLMPEKDAIKIRNQVNRQKGKTESELAMD